MEEKKCMYREQKFHILVLSPVAQEDTSYSGGRGKRIARAEEFEASTGDREGLHTLHLKEEGKRRKMTKKKLQVLEARICLSNAVP